MYFYKKEWNRVEELVEGKTVDIFTYTNKFHQLPLRMRLRVFRPEYYTLDQYMRGIQGYRLGSYVCKCGDIKTAFTERCEVCGEERNRRLCYL